MEEAGKDEVSDAARDNNALRFATAANGFGKKTNGQIYVDSVGHESPKTY